MQTAKCCDGVGGRVAVRADTCLRADGSFELDFFLADAMFFAPVKLRVANRQARVT